MRGETTVGVIGVGSIGSVLASGFDGLGHNVLVNDADAERERESPYPARTKSELERDCACIIVAVPTPTKGDGGDASAVRKVVESVGNANLICIRSTMPPGETRHIADSVAAPVVYSPEFLRDRSGVDDFFNPDRIVLAGPSDARENVRRLLDSERINCSTVIECDDYLTAEIAKEAHNAFFATKVSFANQIRAICEQTGADESTAMDIVVADGRNTSSHLDPRLGPYGGKCLPKDTAALEYFAHECGVPTPLIGGTMEMNAVAKEHYDNHSIEGNWPNITLSSD